MGLKGPEDGSLDLVLDGLRVGELVPAQLDFPADVGFVGEAERVAGGIVVDVEGVVLDGSDCFSDDVLVIVFGSHHGLHHLGGRQSAVGAGGQAAEQDDLGGLFRQGVPELLDGAGVPGDVGVDAGVEGLVMNTVYQFVTDPAVFGGDVPGVDERSRCVPVVPNGGCQQPEGPSHPLEVRVVGQPFPGDPENARVERIGVVEFLLRPVSIGGPMPFPEFRVGLRGLLSGQLVPVGEQALSQDGRYVCFVRRYHVVAGAGQDAVQVAHDLGEDRRGVLEGVVSGFGGSYHENCPGADVHGLGQCGDGGLDPLDVLFIVVQDFFDPLDQLVDEDQGRLVSDESSEVFGAGVRQAVVMFPELLQCFGSAQVVSNVSGEGLGPVARVVELGAR